MVQEVLERASRDAAPPIQFGCDCCGSLLSVPAAMAGAGGPCPLCGAWLVSPLEQEGCGERWDEKPSSVFVSRRPPLVALTQVAPPKLRPEGRINWRERRNRCDRLVSWFQRAQARLCVAALFLAAVLMAYLHSQGWNLPWNVPEDSAVMRVLDSLKGPITGGGDLPTGPVRRN